MGVVCIWPRRLATYKNYALFSRSSVLMPGSFCEVCGGSANFGWPGPHNAAEESSDSDGVVRVPPFRRRRRCRRCARRHMVDLAPPRCLLCPGPLSRRPVASYGPPEGRPVHCRAHVQDGEVEVRSLVRVVRPRARRVIHRESES